jgi:BolA protein
MSLQASIENKVRAAFAPGYLELVNESHQHATRPGAESHFKLVLVSAAFSGQSPVQRHRSVYQVLAEELAAGVHALTLQLFTPAEWEKRGQAQESPPCLGGSGK